MLQVPLKHYINKLELRMTIAITLKNSPLESLTLYVCVCILNNSLPHFTLPRSGHPQGDLLVHLTEG